jgi:O-antigen/teichoic acid export membrane protein
MTTNANVGYYTTGIKFFTMVFGMVNALTTTVIPRISNIIAHKEYDKLGEMAQKLYRFTVGVTLPMVVGLIIVSPYLIVVFCGDGFRPSILVSQITAPLILVVGLSSVFGMQILYPMGKIKIMIKSAAFASIVDLLIVVLLTKNLREDATAIGYLCAEITATCSEVLLGKNFIPIKLRDKHLLLYVIGSAIMALGLYFISLTNLSNIIMVIVMCVVGIIIYGIILMLRKDFIYLSIRNMVLKRVVRHA